MYLESIQLTRTLPCLAEPGKVQIVGTPSASLAKVIPYLATLPGIITYNPERLSLTFRRQPGFLTLLANKVHITQVRDPEEGEELLNNLVEAINATWEQREELVAVTRPSRVLRPLDIYTQLPQTNCGECGEATCMAFAAKLFMQERVPAECPPLFSDPGFEERRATLEAMTQ
ncbi:MAG: (Fe-S)-binding protein [Anaerolineales bacterium]|jgi:ArsR family metal-binding transcriptional regulator